MSENYEYRTTCPNCSKDLLITQPVDHSEYTPGGHCGFCGHYYVMAGYLKLDLSLTEITIVKGQNG